MRSRMPTDLGNSQAGSLIPYRGGGATLALVLLLCLLCSPVSLASEGRFEILSAGSHLENDVWLTDARLELALSSKATEALQSGVKLHIQLQFRVNRSRSFWLDQTVTEITRDIELQYLTLSQRYVVHDLSTGTQTSYASLFSALRSLSQVRDFPLIEAAGLEAEESYRAAMRVVLDRGQLPGPLQMLYFWRGDFILESEWYKWNLR